MVNTRSATRCSTRRSIRRSIQVVEKTKAEIRKAQASGSSDTEVEDTTDEEHESNGDGGSKTEEEPATVPNIDSPISENDKYELMFFAEGFQDGIPAVFHYQIRDELLAAASQLGSYDIPQPRGEAPNDITSFLPSQRSWGPTRPNYPSITFVYKSTEDRHPPYKPQLWYHGGKLVLDWKQRPMVHFQDIPDVLSSNFPGYAMEAIERIDSRIQRNDFLGRMPPYFFKTTVKCGKRYTRKKPLFKPNTLSARMSRFRQQAGCLAWKERVGSDVMYDFLEAHLPDHLKRANTTRGWRDLEPYETAELKLKNLGKFSERSRLCDPEKTSSYIEGFKRRAQALKAKSKYRIAKERQVADERAEGSSFEANMDGHRSERDADGESDTYDAGRCLSVISTRYEAQNPRLCQESMRACAYTNAVDGYNTYDEDEEASTIQEDVESYVSDENVEGFVQRVHHYTAHIHSRGGNARACSHHEPTNFLFPSHVHDNAIISPRYPTPPYPEDTAIIGAPYPWLHQDGQYFLDALGTASEQQLDEDATMSG